MKTTIEALFQMHEPAIWPPIFSIDQDVDDEEVSVTNEELVALAKDLPTGKAPVLDEILSVVLKTAICENPDMFRIQQYRIQDTTIQHCIQEGCSPPLEMAEVSAATEVR